MRNNITKVIVNHLSSNPELAKLPHNAKELVNTMIVDHSNHLLVLALAAAALDEVDWDSLEETLQDIKRK